MLANHVFLGVPAAKPRVWIDLSSTASKRAGLGMHRPGRRVLQWAVKAIGWMAWLPIQRMGLGPVRAGAELDGVAVLDAIRPGLKYATIYMGNDSAKSKLTVATEGTVVKLARTAAAAMAVRQEIGALRRIAGTKIAGLADCVPQVLGEGECGGWVWSEQTKVPHGKSPVRLREEHFRFLRLLRLAGMSHGDFAPWNCSIANGRLYVYDWEDAGAYVAGKDEAWFKKQVRELLGVEP